LLQYNRKGIDFNQEDIEGNFVKTGKALERI